MGSQHNDPEQAPLSNPALTNPTQGAEPAPRPRSHSPKRRRAPETRAEETLGEGPDELAAIYDQLRQISLRAFSSGHLEVAYHALAGALHAAQDLDDTARLEDIEAIAREQMQAIDSGTPNSLFSTKAAGHRGAEPLWATVARHAEMARHLLHSRQQASQTRIRE